MKTIQQLKTQLLFETKQSNAFRMRRNEAQTKETKQAWQTLIDLSEKSQEKLRVQLLKLDKGLKGISKPQSMVDSYIKSNYGDVQKSYEDMKTSIAKYEASPNTGSKLVKQRIKDLHSALTILEKRIFKEAGTVKKSVRNNAGKTQEEAKKRVALKLELKKFGHQRSETVNLTTKQLEALLNKEKKGLKAPAKTKGLTTLCAKQVGVTGRRKSDGTQKKGYVAKKGGQLIKKKTVTKKK